jgi:hypothetical protein
MVYKRRKVRSTEYVHCLEWMRKGVRADQRVCSLWPAKARWRGQEINRSTFSRLHGQLRRVLLSLQEKHDALRTYCVPDALASGEATELYGGVKPTTRHPVAGDVKAAYMAPKRQFRPFRADAAGLGPFGNV